MVKAFLLAGQCSTFVQAKCLKIQRTGAWLMNEVHTKDNRNYVPSLGYRLIKIPFIDK